MSGHFFLVYAVFLGALASPGPDFLVVLRQALAGSPRAGVAAALGVAAGNVVHMGYCLAGIGLLIAGSEFLFSVLKWGGAAYLVYMGVQTLRSRGMALPAAAEEAGPPARLPAAFVRGFVTNLLNPKATLFFLALFTQVIDPAMPFAVRAGYAASFVATAFVWFSAIALVMGAPAMRQGYARLSRVIDRVCGGFFILLGLRLAAARL